VAATRLLPGHYPAAARHARLGPHDGGLRASGIFPVSAT